MYDLFVAQPLFSEDGGQAAQTIFTDFFNYRKKKIGKQLNNKYWQFNLWLR